MSLPNCRAMPTELCQLCVTSASGPGGGANERRGQANEQGNAGPVNEAGQHVTAEFVSPEPVRQSRRAELQALVEFIGVVWGNEVGEDSGECHNQNDRYTSRA